MFRVAIGKQTNEGQELGFEYTHGGVSIRTMWTYRDDGKIYREDWQEMIDSLNAGVDVFRVLDTDGQRHVTFSHNHGAIVINTANAEINVTSSPVKVQIIKCCEELARKHKCRPVPPAVPVVEPAPVPAPAPVEVPVPAPVEVPVPIPAQVDPVPEPLVIPDEVPIVIEQLPPRPPTPPAPVVVPEPVAPVVEPVPVPAPQPDQPAVQIPLQQPAAEHDPVGDAEDNIVAEQDVMKFINQYLGVDAVKN